MRVLAIDVGAKRIGVALSDPTSTLASPWRMIPSLGSIQGDAAAIAALVEEAARDGDAVSTIVVGLPLRLDGSATDQTSRARAIAAALESVTGLPIVLQDERLTSREAESRLALREKDWRKRKQKIDAAAAAIVLQDYLDAQKRED
ncbi:MAG TPA: Holliday junction resolvase RuvX [Vicinamibacterales bacterium]|nr:Holliday junction resolvase RuvX [Vicinamibacterales bacterium]